MRTAVLLLVSILFFGCITESEPLKAEELRINQNEDQIITTIIFSGNDVPERTKGSMTIFADSEIIYNSEFFLRKRDFRKIDGKFIAERYIKVGKDLKMTYANITIYLPNQTFYAEYGNETSRFSSVMIDPLILGNQYAFNIKFIDNNGKLMKENGVITIRLYDDDGEIYKKTVIFTEEDLKNGYLTLSISKAKVNKSFYEWGNVTATATIDGIVLEKIEHVKLERYEDNEKKKEQEKRYLENAKSINKSVDYVGFEFYVVKGGGYTDHLPNRKNMVRFDLTITNLLLNPQYIVREDFYVKDDNGNFHPIFTKTSTSFGPLMRSSEKINVSMYFERKGYKKEYELYYGDKIIGTVKLN